ncbi:S-adenosyl-L-methionine-dependent methyltransferase [Panus rudis PR-1116 ss-1]|nr:S-adenosyl-L-methionine-dependent methyltransferase [Panus rudis PR-1116 ss-1]
MATYSRATYNAARYASIRPTYPRQLYEFVFQYHARSPNARWGTAVDLGCGTGHATMGLTPFKRIIGVEPSAKMVEQAREALKDIALPGQVEFVHSGAEDLHFLQDGSVDLIVSAQAAHWFNWQKVWKEASRVLRKDGSLAAWGYSEFRLSRYPSATPLIHAYSKGSDPNTSVGPYWEQPGRNILDNHLLDIPEPNSVVPNAFKDFERVFFVGDHHPNLPDRRPVILRKKGTWNDLLGYLRTYSSLHTYHEAHPEDLKNPEGDIAVRFWKSLRQHVATQGGKADETDEIDIEWPVAVILAKRA